MHGLDYKPQKYEFGGIFKMEVHIGKISKISTLGGKKTKISAEIFGMEFGTVNLWYQVDSEYDKYLVDDRSDTFLVAILPHLMAHSKDNNPTKVYAENAISEKLYYYLTEIYLPALANFTDMYHKIELHCKTTSEVIETAGAVGTGISGGVDSFYTIVTHKQHKLNKYTLTHGMYINLNAEGKDQVIFTRDDPKVICMESGIQYLYMETNLLTLYGKVTDVTNIFMVTSCAMALQKLFSVYLISGAYPFSHFKWDAHNASNFDIVSCTCLSTNSLEFILTGCDLKRVDKVKKIADNPVVKKHLFICSTPVEDGKNCSKCAKCTQTMLEYYVNGDREKAKDLFDWTYFDKNPSYYWGYIFRKGKEEHYDWPELQKRAKRNGYKVSFGAHISGFIKLAKNGFHRVTKAGLEYRP